MKRTEKKVDFNAHLSEIRTELLREEGKNFLSICLKNVSGKEITSIVFEAKGYDYFGDVIKVEEKDSFLIKIDALHLKTGECLQDKKIEIAGDIRKIELEEKQVIFSDGVLEERKKPQEKIYYVNCFEKDSYRDKPELDELLEQDERFCCYPTENETGWICACTYLNRKENQSCVNCGHAKNEIFWKCSEKAVKDSRRIKQLVFDKHLQQRARIRKRQETEGMIKYVLEVFLVLIAIVFAFWLYLRFR